MPCVKHQGPWSSSRVMAVGASSPRWIPTHGFTINVNPDLLFIDTSVIIPCGIKGRGVRSIAQGLTKKRKWKNDNLGLMPTGEEGKDMNI
eukprot:15353978-Ditylum_brightwellii.AAC.2